MSNCIEIASPSWLITHKAIVPLATQRETACLGNKFMNMLRN